MDKREAQVPIEEATWSSEKEKELRSLRNETKTLKQTMMTLLEGERQKDDENSKLKEKIEQLERNYLKKANAFDNVSIEIQECKEKLKDNKRKMAGIQLTKGNSDITDLSDANRPTKLAEKWSSLFSDEWRYAYDEFTTIMLNENNEIEKELCSIAKKCFNICQEIEKKQMTDIKTHVWDTAWRLHRHPDQLLSAAKTPAATMTPNNKTNNVDLQSIRKCMDELIEIVHERRKYDTNLLEYVKQEVLREFEQYKNMGAQSQIMKFVERCTEICWSMVIKEPPMTLVFNEMEGTTIDKNMFYVYTKIGPFIDFVVWPALILHKDGPILTKGTVQGKENNTIKTKIAMSNSRDDITEKTMDSQYEIPQDGNENLKYIPPFS